MIVDGINLSKPNVLGHLEKGVLDEIERRHRSNERLYSVAGWDSEHGLEPGHLESLGPMVEMIRDYELNTNSNATRSLSIEGMTNVVPRGLAQSRAAGDWHYDGIVRIMMAASAMPTRILYVPDHEDLSLDDQEAISHEIRYARYDEHHFDNDRIEQIVKLGTFAVFQAEPYEVFEMNNAIHQSPTNYSTDQYIQRTFVRMQVS